MAALTDDKEVLMQEGKLQAMPVVASDIIYRGAICKVNAAGFLAPAAAEAGAVMAGIAYEQCDNSAGAAGDVDCRVVRNGVHLLEGSGFSQADVGAKVYASDDQTVSTTQGANEQEVGTIVRFESATQVWVDIEYAVSVGQ